MKLKYPLLLLLMLFNALTTDGTLISAIYGALICI
jgi:hypothetical protein